MHNYYMHNFKESPCAKWQNFVFWFYLSVLHAFYHSVVIVIDTSTHLIAYYRLYEIFLLSHHVSTSKYESFGNTKLESIHEGTNVCWNNEERNECEEKEEEKWMQRWWRRRQQCTFRKIIYTPADRCIIWLEYIIWDQIRWDEMERQRKYVHKTKLKLSIKGLTRGTTKAAATPKQAMQTKWWRKCHKM